MRIEMTVAEVAKRLNLRRTAWLKEIVFAGWVHGKRAYILPGGAWTTDCDLAVDTWIQALDGQEASDV